MRVPSSRSGRAAPSNPTRAAHRCSTAASSGINPANHGPIRSAGCSLTRRGIDSDNGVSRAPPAP